MATLVVVAPTITGCARLPALVPHPEDTFQISGLVHMRGDSAPAPDATVMLLGGRPQRLLAGTATSTDGTFTILLPGETRVACETLTLRVTGIGLEPSQTRPGSLDCGVRCQWLDLQVSVPPTAIDELRYVRAAPSRCGPGRGWPGG